MKLSDYVKKIKHVLIILLILLCSLFGCSSSPDRVVPAPERAKLELTEPSPIHTKNVNWLVITEDNYKDVFQDLKDRKYDVVLIGLTDNDYENLSLNMSELKRYIIEQQFIISAYKQYYESTDNGQEEED